MDPNYKISDKCVADVFRGEYGKYDEEGFFRPETPDRVRGSPKLLSNWRSSVRQRRMRWKIKEKSPYGPMYVLVLVICVITVTFMHNMLMHSQIVLNFRYNEKERLRVGNRSKPLSDGYDLERWEYLKTIR